MSRIVYKKARVAGSNAAVGRVQEVSPVVAGQAVVGSSGAGPAVVGARLAKPSYSCKSNRTVSHAVDTFQEEA